MGKSQNIHNCTNVSFKVIFPFPCQRHCSQMNRVCSIRENFTTPLSVVLPVGVLKISHTASVNFVLEWGDSWQSRDRIESLSIQHWGYIKQGACGQFCCFRYQPSPRFICLALQKNVTEPLIRCKSRRSTPSFIQLKGRRSTKAYNCTGVRFIVWNSHRTAEGWSILNYKGGGSPSRKPSIKCRFTLQEWALHCSLLLKSSIR